MGINKPLEVFPRYLVILSRPKNFSECNGAIHVHELEEMLSGKFSLTVLYAGNDGLAAHREYGNLPVAQGEGKTLVDFNHKSGSPTILARVHGYTINNLEYEEVFQNAALCRGSHRT